MARDPVTGRFVLSGKPEVAPKPKTYCQNGHDLTLPGAIKVKNIDGRYRRTCVTCSILKNQRERIAHKARQEALKQGLRQKINPEDQISDKIRYSPFNVTRVQMEKELGRSYNKWTRAEHREQTIRMYHMLGWGDAAIEGSVLEPRSR